MYMSLTKKIKMIRKLAKEIESEADDNYFSIHNRKYYLKKGKLFTSSHYDNSVGNITMKGNIILNKKHKSRKSVNTYNKTLSRRINLNKNKNQNRENVSYVNSDMNPLEGSQVQSPSEMVEPNLFQEPVLGENSEMKSEMISSPEIDETNNSPIDYQTAVNSYPTEELLSNETLMNEPMANTNNVVEV